MARITAGMAALGAKIGTKLLSVGIKFAKVIKVGKFGLAIGSLATYTYLFTWQFAIMIMVSLFIHEFGHIVAMKRCGLHTKGIYFIPFVGAAAVTDGMLKSRKDEVFIAIMGPVWGFGLAILTALVWIVTDNTLFAAAAGWMAMLNLFNLLPINPLDGGRIMKSITFSINSNMGFIFLGIGIVASMILTLLAGILLFSVLIFISCLELIFEYRRYSAKKEVSKMLEELEDNEITEILKGDEMLKDINWIEYLIPPTMSKKGIIISSVLYVGIIAILWMLMTYMNHVPEVEVARKLFMS